MSLPEVPTSIQQSKFIVLATVVAQDGKTDELKKYLLKIRDRATSKEESGTLRCSTLHATFFFTFFI